MRILYPVIAAAGVAAVLAAAVHGIRPARAAHPGSVHVALIGASIGQGWHLADWPQRVGAPGYTAESFAIWQFDKTEAVDEVLVRPQRKFHLTLTYLRSLLQPPPLRPDLVILKECSSYFPSDLKQDEANVVKWAGQLRAAGMHVALATVVPVTQKRSVQDPGKLEALTQYNTWVRGYAHDHDLPLLDLDAALRSGGPGSYLRDELTIGDGSHVNAAAYKILDDVLLNMMCRVQSAEGCAHAAVPESRT